MKFIDLTGKRFGKLLVQYLLPSRHGKTYWKCLCDCGKDSDVESWKLKNRTRSCGCLVVEKARARVGQLSPNWKGGDVMQKKRSVELKRRAVTEYLFTHSCCSCGNDDPRVLEFDHVKPGGIGFHQIIYGGYSLETLFREIALCEVRCANCHKIRHHDEGGRSSRKLYNRLEYRPQKLT